MATTVPSSPTAARSTRRDILALLVGSAVQDLAFRVAQLALPLVVLAETGSVASTGLVAGVSGLPVVLSPWWALRIRQWVDSGRRLAVVALFDAGAMCVVPAAAALGRLDVVVLCMAGLLLGVGETLSQPGRAALLADVGDRWRPDGAVRLLTRQDLLRRIGMVVGPALGGLAVAAGMATALLWSQAVAIAVSGVLAWKVQGDGGNVAGEPDAAELRIRDALVDRPLVLAGWLVRGTSCLTWFAFALGLAVLGAQQGRPATLIAWGMTGYGVGAITGTLVATWLIARWPVLRVIRVSWCVTGIAWLVLGLWPEPVGSALGGAIAGGFVVLGITAVNAAITRSSTASTRRTLLSGQAVVVSATSSVGMLAGGPLLAVVGVRPTLVATGLLVVLVTLVATERADRRAENHPARGGSRPVQQESGLWTDA